MNIFYKNENLGEVRSKTPLFDIENEPILVGDVVSSFTIAIDFSSEDIISLTFKYPSMLVVNEDDKIYLFGSEGGTQYESDFNSYDRNQNILNIAQKALKSEKGYLVVDVLRKHGNYKNSEFFNQKLLNFK